MYPKCAICRHARTIHAFQPFGPDDKPLFTALGSHYRGFPVIPVCDECKQRILSGAPYSFTYQGDIYTASAQYTDGKIVKSPF